MPITDFVMYDRRGFSVSDFVPLTDYGKHFPVPLEIVQVSWRDSQQRFHELDTRNLSVDVLPDKSGLMCLEKRPSIKGRYTGKKGAFVLNEDASLRYKLKIPVDLIDRDVPPDADRYFCYSEYLEKYGKSYRLIAEISTVGRYYFELDYHTGQFLGVWPMRY
jgi:hypothetical protein